MQSIPLSCRAAPGAAGGTRVEPSRRAVAQGDGFKYTPAVATDIAARFRAVRAEQKRAQDAAQRAAVNAAQRAKAHAQCSLPLAAAPDDKHHMPRFLQAVR